jgi:hypothetical protein
MTSATEVHNRAAKKQLPKATLDAIDWVFSLKDERRL